MRIFRLFLASLMVATACTKEISVQQSFNDFPIVLSCFPQPGFPQKVHLSYPTAITRLDRDSIPCYESLRFWVNDTLVYKSQTHCDTLINLPVELLPGDRVRLELTTEQRILNATDRIPGGSFELQAGTWALTTQKGGESLTTYGFILKEADEGQNFYAFQSFLMGPTSISHPIGVAAKLHSNHPELQREGDLNVENLTYPLADFSFNGNSTELTYSVEYFHFTTPASLDIPSQLIGIDESLVYVRVWEISSTHYRFLKSWIRHQHSLQTGNYRSDDVLEAITQGEPSFLYSNIEGGLGIFAARSAPVYLKLEER